MPKKLKIGTKPTKSVAEQHVSVATTQTAMLNPLSKGTVLNGVCIMVLMAGLTGLSAGTAAAAGFAALAVGVKQSNRLTPDTASVHIDYSEGSFTVEKDKNKAPKPFEGKENLVKTVLSGVINVSKRTEDRYIEQYHLIDARILSLYTMMGGSANTSTLARKFNDTIEACLCFMPIAANTSKPDGTQNIERFQPIDTYVETLNSVVKHHRDLWTPPSLDSILLKDFIQPDLANPVTGKTYAEDFGNISVFQYLTDGTWPTSKVGGESVDTASEADAIMALFTGDA